MQSRSFRRLLVLATMLLLPITAYAQLTANQIKSRLGDLSPAELRQVHAREKRGKARKGVLEEIERRLK